MWKTVKLGDVCAITNGSTPYRKEKSYWEKGNIPWFTIEDLRLQGKNINYTQQKVTQAAVDDKKVRLVPVNSVLLCCTASIGEVAIARVEMATNQQFNALTPISDELNSDYLYFVATTLTQTLLNVSGSTTINFISMGKLKDINISLPPLAEQQRIVAKLDAAFAEIDKAIQLAYLKEIEIEQLGVNLLSNFLNDRKYILEDVKLEDVCLKLTDGSHFSPKTVENGFPYITVRDINHDGIDFTNCKFISKESYLELSKNGCSPSEGDLLFSKDGTVGKVAEVKTKKDFAVLSSLAILTPNKDLISTELLAYILKSKSFLREAIGQKTGTAIRRIILKNLKKICFKLPSFSRQDSLVSKLDAASAEIELARNAIKRIRSNYHALKSSILKQELQSKVA